MHSLLSQQTQQVTYSIKYPKHTCTLACYLNIADNDERASAVNSLELTLRATLLRAVSAVGGRRRAVEDFQLRSAEVAPPRFEEGLAAARLVPGADASLALSTSEQGRISWALVALAVSSWLPVYRRLLVHDTNGGPLGNVLPPLGEFRWTRGGWLK